MAPLDYTIKHLKFDTTNNTIITTVSCHSMIEHD